MEGPALNRSPRHRIENWLGGLPPLSTWTRHLPGLIGWAALIVFLVQAAGLRYATPPVAISEWDSWGWLKPALGWIGGLGFHEEYEREWLYGAFIAGCLRLTGSFAGYIVIQQILGLAAAILTWLTWRTWLRLFPQNILFDTVASAVVLVTIHITLQNPILRALEISIRPEAIMNFVAMAQLLCLALFFRFRWHEPRAGLAVIFGAFAILFAVAMYVLKPNWLLAVPATTLPVFAGMFGRAIPLRPRIGTVIVGGCLVFSLLWLPAKFFFERSSKVHVVLPMTLFTIHANIIREDLAVERTDPSTPAGQQKFLDDFLPLLDREIANAITANIIIRPNKRNGFFYERLGFDPDYLMYRATIFPTLSRTMTQEELAAFCKSSFLSAMLHQPGLYTGKVLRQMDYFFRPSRDTFGRKEIKLGEIYTYSVTTVPEQLTDSFNQSTQEVFHTYHLAAEESAGSPDRLEQGKKTRRFLERVAWWAPWVTIGFTLTLIATLCGKPLAFLRLPGLLAAFFYAAPFGNALTVAMVHALDNDRYRGSYGPFLLFALAAMAVYVATALAWSGVLAYRHFRRA